MVPRGIKIVIFSQSGAGGDVHESFTLANLHVVVLGMTKAVLLILLRVLPTSQMGLRAASVSLAGVPYHPRREIIQN